MHDGFHDNVTLRITLRTVLFRRLQAAISWDYTGTLSWFTYKRDVCTFTTQCDFLRFLELFVTGSFTDVFGRIETRGRKFRFFINSAANRFSSMFKQQRLTKRITST